MEYSFDIEIAEEHGVDEAIIIKNFQFWISKNRATNKHFYDGRYWTYNSKKAFSELFPFWNETQIKRILNSLINQNILITGNHNKVSYDRTLWYAFKDEERFLIQSIGQNHPMEKRKLSNRTDKNLQPIPDIKPDVNADEKQEREESLSPSEEKEESNTHIESQKEDIEIRSKYVESKKHFSGTKNKYYQTLQFPKQETPRSEFFAYKDMNQRAIRDRDIARLQYEEFEERIINYFKSDAEFVVKNRNNAFAFFCNNYEKFSEPQMKFEKPKQEDQIDEIEKIKDEIKRRDAIEFAKYLENHRGQNAGS